MIISKSVGTTIILKDFRPTLEPLAFSFSGKIAEYKLFFKNYLATKGQCFLKTRLNTFNKQRKRVRKVIYSVLVLSWCKPTANLFLNCRSFTWVRKSWLASKLRPCGCHLYLLYHLCPCAGGCSYQMHQIAKIQLWEAWGCAYGKSSVHMTTRPIMSKFIVPGLSQQFLIDLWLCWTNISLFIPY